MQKNNNEVYTSILDLITAIFSISICIFLYLCFLFVYSIISLLLSTFFSIIHIIINRNVMRGLKRPNTVK